MEGCRDIKIKRADRIQRWEVGEIGPIPASDVDIGRTGRGNEGQCAVGNAVADREIAQFDTGQRFRSVRIDVRGVNTGTDADGRLFGSRNAIDRECDRVDDRLHDHRGRFVFLTQAERDVDRVKAGVMFARDIGEPGGNVLD